MADDYRQVFEKFQLDPFGGFIGIERLPMRSFPADFDAAWRAWEAFAHALPGHDCLRAAFERASLFICNAGVNF